MPRVPFDGPNEEDFFHYFIEKRDRAHQTQCADKRVCTGCGWRTDFCVCPGVIESLYVER